MSAVQGTLKPDGSLELDEKVPLPAGRLKVTVQIEAAKAVHETLLDRMEKIWSEQKARGFVPRSVEEVETERRALRVEDETHLQRLKEIHDESRQS